MKWEKGGYGWVAWSERYGKVQIQRAKFPDRKGKSSYILMTNPTFGSPLVLGTYNSRKEAEQEAAR